MEPNKQTLFYWWNEVKSMKRVVALEWNWLKSGLWLGPSPLAAHQPIPNKLSFVFHLCCSPHAPSHPRKRGNPTLSLSLDWNWAKNIIKNKVKSKEEWGRKKRRGPSWKPITNCPLIQIKDLIEGPGQTQLFFPLIPQAHEWKEKF